jgi:N-glycosylase/DNA lyase
MVTTWLQCLTYSGAAACWIGAGFTWFFSWRTRRMSRQVSKFLEETRAAARTLDAELENIIRMRAALRWIALQPRPPESLHVRDLLYLIGSMQRAATRALGDDHERLDQTTH